MSNYIVLICHNSLLFPFAVDSFNRSRRRRRRATRSSWSQGSILNQNEYFSISNAQQSCVPATALKRKVTKQQFCLSVSLPVLSICPLRLSKNPSKNPSKILPKSFQIVAKMVQNRGLEGAWGCLVACLRPKAPVGRFLEGSGAALGRLLAHLGRLLGGSWAVLGARLGRPRAP